MNETGGFLTFPEPHGHLELFPNLPGGEEADSDSLITARGTGWPCGVQP